MSKLGQLRTCLSLMTVRQNSCLSHLKELSISIAYLPQSLLPTTTTTTTTATAVLHYHMSLTCGRKSHRTPTTLAPDHTPCLFSIDRSFSFASSSVWNSIPNDVRSAPSLSSFKSCLKTYLFRSAYKD